jgi:S-adenosylmethionine/arginine decarboxylase-like enzyme
MAKGWHLMCDLSGVSEEVCSNDEFLLEIGSKIAIALRVEILHSFRYNFRGTKYPDGCSVVLVLSGSHVAFHTFAKDGALALDVFCCNRDGWQDVVLGIIQHEIGPDQLRWHKEKRF